MIFYHKKINKKISDPHDLMEKHTWLGALSQM